MYLTTDRRTFTDQRPPLVGVPLRHGLQHIIATVPVPLDLRELLPIRVDHFLRKPRVELDAGLLQAVTKPLGTHAVAEAQYTHLADEPLIGRRLRALVAIDARRQLRVHIHASVEVLHQIALPGPAGIHPRLYLRLIRTHEHSPLRGDDTLTQPGPTVQVLHVDTVCAGVAARVGTVVHQGHRQPAHALMYP